MAFCPPNSTALVPGHCVCDTGFTPSNDLCGTCSALGSSTGEDRLMFLLFFLVRITNQLYVDGDSAAPNITNLTDNACIKWFGTGSVVSNRGRYCVCKSTAYFVSSTSNCRKRVHCFSLCRFVHCHRSILPATLGFLINAETEDIKGPCNCPENSKSTASVSVFISSSLAFITSHHSIGYPKQMLVQSGLSCHCEQPNLR